MAVDHGMLMKISKMSLRAVHGTDILLSTIVDMHKDGSQVEELLWKLRSFALEWGTLRDQLCKGKMHLGATLSEMAAAIRRLGDAWVCSNISELFDSEICKKLKRLEYRLKGDALLIETLAVFSNETQDSSVIRQIREIACTMCTPSVTDNDKHTSISRDILYPW